MGVGFGLRGLDALQQHLLVIASHAERNAPGLHPCEGVDASRPAVDQIAQCEEAVALGRELDPGQQALQRRELAVHVSDDEIATGGGILPHPKLRNDLRRPTMEEIGHRTDVLAFEGLGEDARAYLDWLLGECAEDGVDTLIEPAALDLMAMRLSAPLQFAEHLNRAFEAGFRMGQKPITADIVAATLAPDFDDLEPRLTRQGYSVKVLAEQFHTRPTEIRRFLNGQLDAGRTRELADRMRAVGLAL